MRRRIVDFSDAARIVAPVTVPARTAAGLERAGIRPEEQPAPGWAQFVAEVTVRPGGETPILEARGRYGQIDVHAQVPANWSKADVYLRVYALGAAGRVLLCEEPVVAFTGSSTFTKLVRLGSYAVGGAAGFALVFYAPTSAGDTSGQATISVEASPGGAPAGNLALPLGTAAGHYDRPEHLRGAATLGLADDGRWYAVAVDPDAPIGSSLATRSLADPSDDYEEHAAPVIATGRAIRNATAAAIDVVVTTAAGFARQISAIPPGGSVSVRIAGIVSSTGYPVGIYSE